MRRLAAALLAAVCLTPPGPATAAQVDNTRSTVDVWGAPVDAHDGTIVQDAAGTSWLFGTSYGCGFQLNRPSPWCGVRVYRSTDLQTWTPAGAIGGMYAFDAFGSQWQVRCTGDHFGCFRPHAARRSDGTWVMWINTPSMPAAYAVLTASAPGGPYTETEAPRIAVNDGGTRLAGGDLDLTVDGDTAWLSYVSISPTNTPADIVVERLDPTWTTGTGQFARLGRAMVESPALFRRGATWYLLYSAPAKPYGITGAAYATALSPLGPWTVRGQISATSCQGQSADVNEIRSTTGVTRWVWQVDRWAQSGGTFALNQFRANNYLAPLSFSADGSIVSPGCLPSWTL